MKTIKIKLNLLLVLILSLALTSCFDDKYDEINKTINYSNFDFKTTKQLNVSVTTLSNTNQPISGAFIELYTQNPLNSDGSLIENYTDYLVFKGVTTSNGTLNCKVATTTTTDSLCVIVNYVGLPFFQQYKISSTDLNVTIGGNIVPNSAPRKVVSNSLVVTYPDPVIVNGYYVLGSWTSSGKPNYLWATNDAISTDFLADVNASLPEQIKLTTSHPEYLSTANQGSIVLIEDAEVWVTFVHEGAGYLNVLGYYTHPTNSAPATINEISDATIIFPNVSYTGSGGSLVSGNKVQLLYLNPTTKKYTNVFPAGTTVAWFLKANGFSGGNVLKTGTTYYSDLRFNPESTTEKKIHNVLLKDNARKLLLLGFEDLNRNNGSDEDFNDAVFYSTVTPYTAVKSDFYQAIDTPKDTDGDGIGDSVDEYPNDAQKAFNNYYPAKNQVATLAFEDLWPNKGDYDFNDLVLDYNYNQITNANNDIVEVLANLTVRAIGASLRNQFAISFNTTPQNVKSVTGQLLNKGVFSVNSNGTEQGQSKAVIPVFEDPFSVLGYNGSIVNTVLGGTYVEPKTIVLDVQFNNPISLTQFGTAPYNPFIVIGGNRGMEVHLPGGEPTDLVDKSLFGTGDDNTDLSIEKYYMSDKYLPWAINIPVKFDYPSEKQDITKTYLMFNNWAKSRGYSYMDWYQVKTGYRDNTKIFVKK